MKFSVTFLIKSSKPTWPHEHFFSIPNSKSALNIRYFHISKCSHMALNYKFILNHSNFFICSTFNAKINSNSICHSQHIFSHSPNSTSSEENFFQLNSNCVRCVSVYTQFSVAIQK